MTPADIATIRNLRGCNVPWPVIAKQIGHSVAECRAAIGMPVIGNTKSEPAPWRSGRDLFSDEKDHDQ